jgi:hypothetical protein
MVHPGAARAARGRYDKYAQRTRLGALVEDAAEGAVEASGRHQLLASFDGAHAPTSAANDCSRSDCSSVEELAPSPPHAMDDGAPPASRGAAFLRAPAASPPAAAAAPPPASSLGVDLAEVVISHPLESLGGPEPPRATLGDAGAAADDADTSPRASAALGDEGGEGGEGDTCWICFHGPRDAVLLECGHGGICHACAVRCASKRPPLCPMCRQRIGRIVRLAGPEEVVDGEVVVSLQAEPEA